MRRVNLLTILVVSVVLMAACGTRQDHDDIVAASAANGRSEQVDAASALGPGVGASDAGSGTDAVQPDESSPIGAAAAAPRAGPVASDRTAPGGSADTASGRLIHGREGAKSPIKLGSVGVESGPLGAVFNPIAQAVRAWSRAVNDRGGINGHPVKISFADDGFDPARHRAEVQQLVETEKVIGFLGNREAVTGPASVDYIQRVRVPVIGTDTASGHYYKHTMYFPEVANQDPKQVADLASLASVAVPKGLKRVAIVACSEGTNCTRMFAVADAYKAELGLDIVYRARASVAQPDYTAECLASRNAGAQTLLAVLDATALSRLAFACHRQGYRPLFGSVVVTTRQQEVPELEGAAFGSQPFPWVSDDTPARAEFQRAIQKYAPNTDIGSFSALGWTGAKLFEKAAANMPEPPTSEALLRGLWSIHDDDLGGLTYPLTFIGNKPSAPRACYYPMQIHNRRWTVLGDGKVRCRPFHPIP